MTKLYTPDNQFIKEVDVPPPNFTGILEFANGDKYWLLNGNWHREDGPACQTKIHNVYRINGKLHRLNGPAIENHENGLEQYFIHGVECKLKEHHKLLVDMMKLKGLI